MPFSYKEAFNRKLLLQYQFSNNDENGKDDHNFNNTNYNNENNSNIYNNSSIYNNADDNETVMIFMMLSFTDISKTIRNWE